MVVIRLARGGSKKKPFYNIVVADSRSPRDGKFIERLGFYNPIARGQEVCIHLVGDKFKEWTDKGAKSSPRVSSLYKLYLKNNSQDIVARLAKTTKPSMDDNKPAKVKVKETVSEE